MVQNDNCLDTVKVSIGVWVAHCSFEGSPIILKPMAKMKRTPVKKHQIPFRQFFNRELSWLAFNDRVLEEAQDLSYPPLERLKFVSIVSSNLDEFFMIRVAGLERKVKRSHRARDENGSPIEELLYQIREWALAQKARQGSILRDALKLLRKEGPYLQIDAPEPSLLDQAKKLLPEVKIQLFTSADSLVHLVGGKIYVFVRFKDKFAILSFSESADRLIYIAPELAQGRGVMLCLSECLWAPAQQYFANDIVLEAFAFKIIRDADVIIDPDTDPEELLSTVEEALETRAKQSVVRREVDAPHISDGALLLANSFKLSIRGRFIAMTCPLDLKILWRLYNDPLNWLISNFQNGVTSPILPRECPIL